MARMRLVGDWRPAEPAFTHAAIRETFEECGLLFATTPVDPERLRAARTKMLEGTRSFNETLTDLDVQLDAKAIRYFSRWITPPSIQHRFDARFYDPPRYRRARSPRPTRSRPTTDAGSSRSR